MANRRVLVVPYYMAKEDTAVSFIVSQFNSYGWANEVNSHKSSSLGRITALLSSAISEMLGGSKIPIKGRYNNDGFNVLNQESEIDYAGQATTNYIEITEKGRQKYVNMVAIFTCDSEFKNRPCIKYHKLPRPVNLKLIKLCKIDYDVELHGDTSYKPKGSIWLNVKVGHNHLIGEGVLDEDKIIVPSGNA